MTRGRDPAGGPAPDRRTSPLVGAARPRAWETARGRLALDPPLIVGILNVTPDSFSDGGCFLSVDAAIRHAEQLASEGAGMLDVGAESTRPGASRVPPEEEWRRLHPVLEALARRLPAVGLSVDTTRSATAARALEAGAWAINDVSGLRLDPGIADACARHGAGLVLMHSRGSVEDMASYALADYRDDVATEVARELEEAVHRAVTRGVSRERVVVDPGLGFAKTPEQSVATLRGLATLARLGLPIMVGPSRKRFLGEITGRDLHQRDIATAAACAVAYLHGASIFRVHAVAPAKDALAVARALSAN